MRRKLSKIGKNSYGVIISPVLLDILKIDISKSYDFDVSIKDGGIFLSDPRIIVDDKKTKRNN